MQFKTFLSLIIGLLISTSLLGQNKVGVISLEEVETGVEMEEKGALDGIWENVDAETRGITKILFSDGDKGFQAWGSCHPTDCDWGEQQVEHFGGIMTVTYDRRFVHRLLVIELVGAHRMEVLVRSVFKDGRGVQTKLYRFERLRELELIPLLEEMKTK